MAVTAGLWILVSVVTVRALEGSPALPAALAFVAVSAVLIPIDLREHRLPRRVLLPGLAILLVVQMVSSLQIGEPERLAWVLAGSVVAVIGFVIARRAAPGGVAYGDAAFEALVGGMLGWFGPGRVALGLALGLVLGSVMAGPVALAQRHRLLAVSPGIALRPALAAGAWIALCWGDTVVAAARG